MNSDKLSHPRWEKISGNEQLVSKALDRSERDLAASESLLKTNHYDWSLSVSYNAMLSASRALMFSQNFRPAGEGQHAATIAFVREKFGNDFAGPFLFFFEKLRKERHINLYEEAGRTSQKEAKSALLIAKDFVQKVRVILK